MNQAIVRSFRSHHQLPAGVVISPTSNQVSREVRVPWSTGFVSLRKGKKAFCTNPDSKHDMDKAQEPKDKKGDAMSHSFGEGYATRSDEEGFGGIYGGNDDDDVKLDKKIHEDHPDYDRSQGSEVKEKEKARNQATANH
ncbi:unnamed protein product [Linum trigynum]|uniref:Uncharacterized protein n=1 Tax=Linum trigynum TaxID=586398 RepID=A0AAV2DSV7_9ROSI